MKVIMQRHNPAPRPMPDTGLLARFAAIVGPAHAIAEPTEQAPYLEEWRDLWHGKTPLVLRPGSTAEVAAIMELAHETGTAIVPQGGNTGLVGGQIPFGHEILVSLGRLARIRAIDPDGNTITVEAGVPLAKVQEAAASLDRLYPLSLASQGSCQIGGNLSTNAGGVAVLAYGNARDSVLGLEVVLADGRIWEGLRALRKDNTGYDLKSLFLGSEGTLGIITAAVLKLFPRPRETTVAFAGLASLEAVRALFERMRAASGPMLTAFEIMPERAMEFLTRHVADARDPLGRRHPWYALIELSGHQGEGETRALVERVLGAAIEDGIAADAAIAETLQQTRALWHLRESLPDTQRHEGGSIKHDVSVPVARLPELIERGNILIEAMMPGARPLPFGHFGDGNLHYNVSQPPGMAKDRFLAEWAPVNARIHALVLELGGSISAEHGVGRLKREEIARIKSATEMELMRTLKAALDPKGILNPGKVL